MIGELPPVMLLLEGIAFTSVVTTLAWAVALWAGDRWHENYPWRLRAAFPALAALLSALLVLRFGCSILAMMGALYILLSLYASYSDLKCREVDNQIQLMMLLVGLIGRQPEEIPSMALTALVASLPMVLVIALTRSPLGGADLKFTAAYAFGAGVVCGIAGLIMGLLAALIHQGIRHTKRDQGFPLIPYLSAGFILAFILFGGA